jgi:hypothetical protein
VKRKARQMANETLESSAARLVEDGYKVLTDHPRLKVGRRVHNRGELYAQASDEGTATILAVYEKSPSSWSQKYGRRDIEVIVEHETKSHPRTVRVWADYGTETVGGDTNE